MQTTFRNVAKKIEQLAMQVMGNDRLKKSLTFLKCKFDIYPPTKEIFFFFGLRMNFPFEF